MSYAQETYLAAASWYEETRISYVANAKKGNTMSAERYERYSKAATFGEALKLGSKPADLLHDFEKRFILVDAVQPDMTNATPLTIARSRPALQAAEAAGLKLPDRPERLDRPVKKTSVQEGGGSAEKALTPPKPEKKRDEQKPEKKKEETEKRKREEPEKKESDHMTQLRNEKKKHMLVLMEAMGLDYKAAVDLKLAPDNLAMMTERLMSDRLAQLVLEATEEQKRRVTDKEVLAVLKLWHFKRNEARQNVLPNGQKWVHSDTFGLIRCRTGAWMVTSASQEYPHVTRILNTWLRARCPEEMQGEFPCTSISLNSNYAAKRHRDGNNAGPSMIRGFGKYTGGELAYWPDDDRSTYVEDLHHDDREVMDLSKNLVLFDGNRGHEVNDFQGERFSVVWFSAGKYWTMGKENCDFLREIGFGAKEEEELGPVLSMLPPPLGYPRSKSLSAMFGLAEKKKVAKVRQWMDTVDGKEEEQAQKLLDDLLTTELEAFVRAKEACDAAVHAANIADDLLEAQNKEKDGAEAAEPEKGALDTLFKAAAEKKKQPNTDSGVPASPPPTSRSNSLFGASTGEKSRAPDRKDSSGEDMPPAKRSRQGEERPHQEAIIESSLESFQPELAANQEELRRGEFRSLATVLEVGSLCALTNYFRLTLHCAKDPEGSLSAVLLLLAPSMRLPENLVRRAVSEAFGCKLEPGDDLSRAVLNKRAGLRAWKQLTISSAAEVIGAALDELSRVRSSSEAVIEQEERRAIGRLVEILSAVNEGRDAQIMVGLLQGLASLSRTLILEALGQAFALSKPPVRSIDQQAVSRTFASDAAKQAQVSAMRKVVPLAYGEVGGSGQELLTALMEDTAPTQFLARCAPSCGRPVLPMEAMQTKDMDVVFSRMAGLDVAVERRYSGRRVQIHRIGDCIAIFGDDQQDLGGSLGKEQLTVIRDALVSNACVVDAVAICSNDSGSDEVSFVATDCLWLNGRALTRRSLHERHEALRRTITQCSALHIAPQERFFAEQPPTEADVKELLAEAKAAASSGLIFKSVNGSYESGRTSEAWLSLDIAQA